jgi:hypothetical protein
MAADRHAAGTVAEVRLGSVLVSLLDPDRGREAEFNRWYERDHFYSGCMVGSHFFSGRRFVATRRLKDERLPLATPPDETLRDGSYLALYWILAGHHEEAETWAVERVRSLIANDRMMSGRRAVHAGFYDSRFSVSAEVDGVPAELALEHPFAGVGMTFLEAPTSSARAALLAAMENRLLPDSLAAPGDASGVELCIGLTPLPLPAQAPSDIEREEGLDRSVLLLSFLRDEPAGAFRNWTQRLAALLGAEGLAELRLAAPFIPTIPGTDRYADELW